MKQLQVIHVEDSAADSELMSHTLRSDGMDCHVRRVETRSQLEAALAMGNGSTPDLIVSDCSLPQFSGLEALEVARTLRPEIPFIFFSGTIGEETAIESLQNGATDYVLKHRMARLVPSVRRALTEAQGRKVRVAMEAQLRQSRKLEAIGTSVGGIAHDFRNMLQVMKLGIEMLFLDADNPESVVEIASRLNVASDRGRQMIEELMAFSRKADTQLVAEDLSRLTRETVQALRGVLPAEIELSLHLADNSPPVMADGAQFDRILTNLLINARDAMPEGGRIVVSSDVVQFDRIPPGSFQIKNTPYLRIMVSDTGTGMDEATQARIFEPFFTTKSVGKGTGLGLSVVFGLMEAHQGFIDLESTKGQGTTFSLFFPVPAGAVLCERIHLVAPQHLVGKVAEPVEDEDYEV